MTGSQPHSSQLPRPLHRLLRGAYHRLPFRVREKVFIFLSRFSFARLLFRESSLRDIRTNSLIPLDHESGVHLVDLTNAESQFQAAPGTLAVHCHIYYVDLVPEFHKCLSNIPFEFDLYISTTSEEGKNACLNTFTRIPQLGHLIVEVVANRGRDIAPLLCNFGTKLQQYDFVGHFHTKKSLYNKGMTLGWREYLLGSLLGSESTVKSIFRMFKDDPELGIVYPQAYWNLPYYAHCWLANEHLGNKLCRQLGVQAPMGYFNYPTGSMFWARTIALQPLFDLRLNLSDFEEERGQTDGTLAHALERLLGIVPRAQGYILHILCDNFSRSWSPFRIDQQYLTRTADYYSNRLANTDVQLVAFDIFDTLLTRPLVTPDHTKALVSLALSEKHAEAFQAFRHMAERNARSSRGRDVELETIYQYFQGLSGLSWSEVSIILDVERQIEALSVEIRSAGFKLLQKAKELGKRVVLISDMFLALDDVKKMLERHEISGWERIYLSSSTGVRKETGDLYRVMLEQEDLKPSQVLMIGDNERSDYQLPKEQFGLECIHLLTSTNLARALPIYRNIVSQKFLNGNLDRELGVGLIIQERLNEIADFDIHPIDIFDSGPFELGFSLLGPILVCFCDWLVKQAEENSADHLYFLSREGQLIQTVYNIWCQTNANPPPGSYLQLSRRAVTVPRIAGMDDVCAIASEPFFRCSLEVFLFERFGLQLSKERWREIFDKGLWKRGEQLEIQSEPPQKLILLLSFLFSDILTQAQCELPALMSYLKDTGIADCSNPVVVDIGYSGTIQKALGVLLDKDVNGLYLATSDKIEAGLRQNSYARGLFADEGISAFSDSLVLSQSFYLEKLLSSNDAQLNHYAIRSDEKIEAVFKKLRKAELASSTIRDELQSGVKHYATRSVGLKKTIHPNFKPDPLLADFLFSTFAALNRSKRNPVIDRLVLDDDYCGRKLV